MKALAKLALTIALHSRGLSHPTHIPAGTYARATRINATGYGLVTPEGETYVARTVNCAVTPAPGMTYRVTGGARPWLRFYDSSGEEEGDCELVRAGTVSFGRQDVRP